MPSDIADNVQPFPQLKKKRIKVWKIKVSRLGICIVEGKLPDSCQNSLIKVLGREGPGNEGCGHHERHLVMNTDSPCLYRAPEVKDH